MAEPRAYMSVEAHSLHDVFATVAEAAGQGVSGTLQNTKTTGWLNASGSFVVPPYTQTINYTMDFETTSASNTGLIDNNVLTIAGATTTTLSSSVNPAVLGSTINLTASVSPSGTAGTVTFYDGSSVLGSYGLFGNGFAFDVFGKGKEFFDQARFFQLEI